MNKNLVLVLVCLLASISPAAAQSNFRRGDADGDGRVVPIRDAWWIVQSLFSAAAPPPCEDATDVNDDGSTDIADVVDLLTFGYVAGGLVIPAPGPLVCGPDPTIDSRGCETYRTCPGMLPEPTDPAFEYRLPTMQGEVGATAVVVLELDNTSSDGLAGWSVGVCHDPSVVQLNHVGLGVDVAPHDPDFSDVVFDSEGFAAGVLMSFFLFDSLDPGLGLEILDVTYDLVAPGTSPLHYCDDVGNLTLANHVLTLDGIAIPVQLPGELLVVPATWFRRGDTNGDMLFDIADPIFGVMFLFAGGAPPLCRDAGDANDDGVLDIGDAVFMLSALFGLDAPSLPLPGSASCGVDPTTDLLNCASQPDCP